ncbi:MAG: hypothetical protein R6W68_07085, partial [Ignavibacteriaceae bacterium]
LSTILYFIAGLLVVYSVWTVVYSVNYISTMIQQGQLAFSGNEFEIVSFYMSNTAQYVLFAIILFVLGKILLYFSYIEEEADIDATLESSIEENGNDDDQGRREESN